MDGDIGDTQFKGVLRKVLGPGRYRINPYGYEVKVVKTEEIKGDQTTKYSGWVQIPTGYVGVVTNLADNPEARQRAGVQDVTLPPGIYPMNPREQQVDLISVGYTQTTISADKVKDDSGALKLDEAGEPLVSTSENKGINFPAADGFPILMEFTAVWGLMPNQCARGADLRHFETGGKENRDAADRIHLPQSRQPLQGFRTVGGRETGGIPNGGPGGVQEDPDREEDLALVRPRSPYLHPHRSPQTDPVGVHCRRTETDSGRRGEDGKGRGLFQGGQAEGRTGHHDRRGRHASHGGNQDGRRRPRRETDRSGNQAADGGHSETDRDF